jgi:hypothetical protein
MVEEASVKMRGHGIYFVNMVCGGEGVELRL